NRVPSPAENVAADFARDGATGDNHRRTAFGHPGVTHMVPGLRRSRRACGVGVVAAGERAEQGDGEPPSGRLHEVLEATEMRGRGCPGGSTASNLARTWAPAYTLPLRCVADDFLDTRLTERRNPHSATIDTASALEIVDLIGAE